MSQMTMFDDEAAARAPPRSANARVTSRAAGVAAKPNAGTQRRRVLGFLVARPEVGGTDLEIQEELSLPGDTERPRRRELQLAGLVTDSGKVRQTKAGRASVVWEATDLATIDAPKQPVFPDPAARTG